MAGLEWPVAGLPKSQPHTSPLSSPALRLLKLLVDMVKDKDFVIGRSQIGYEATLNALGIRVAEGRAGEQLKRHGLTELATWLLESRLPAITGIIVNISGQRRNLPGGEYYEAFGRADADEKWRNEEIRKSVSQDWTTFL
jgi:hypothetical protein